MSTSIKDYLEIKKFYPQHLLFYRLGEFYELFFDDAKVVSEKLSIVLNQKNFSGNIVETCGIPAKSLNNNCNKLLKSGLKIVVAEQFLDMEKSTKNNPKFIRKVTKILTPGTIIEEDGVEENNILLAISEKNFGHFDLCWGNILIEEFYVDNIARNQLESYLQLISPQEILVEENLKSLFENSDYCVSLHQTFTSKNIENFLEIFSKNNNAALKLIINYISQIHENAEFASWQINDYQDNQFLKLDQNTIENLELINSKAREKNTSLIAIMDKTKTAMGKRLLKKSILKPLSNIHKINQRLDAVAFLLDEKELHKNIISQLQIFPDLEKISAELNFNKKTNAKNLLLIREGLQILAYLAQILSLHNNKKPLPGKLKFISEELICDSGLINKLNSALQKEAVLTDKAGFFIKENFDAALDNLQNKRRFFYDQIKNLEIKYQKQTGIKNLKIEHNNILGYFIEAKTNSASKFAGHPDFELRQNLINNVRYSTSNLRNCELEINNLTNKILALENEILKALFAELILKIDHIKKSAKLIAKLDLLSSFAILAGENNYSSPQFSEQNHLEIISGRNPIIEKFKTNFVAGNCTLNAQNRIWLISGANMAGKSTFLRQNALIAIMAHMGSFVPAKLAKIGILKQIFTRIGSSDNLSKNQSSFMLEMTGIAEIINNADKNSLIIIDEIGNSTTSEYAVALAYAIINYLHDFNFSKALISTHHLKLCKLLDGLKNLENYQMTISKKNGDIEFDYHMQPGIAESSFALDVVKLTTLPNQIITTAEKLLSDEKLDKFCKEQ